MESTITIRNLKKNAGKVRLEIDNLEIPKGCLVCLRIENQELKTMLIKCMLNIILKYEGNITIFNKNVREHEALKDVGVVLEGMFFPESLKVKDIPSILRSIRDKWDDTLFSNLLNRFDIPLNLRIKELDKGKHKKLKIATALARKPRLLILDEITKDLNAKEKKEIVEIFKEFLKNKEHTILFITQDKSDFEGKIDKEFFINEGKLGDKK